MVVPKFRAWDTFDEDMVNDIFFSWQDCGYESLNECLSDERWKFMQSTGKMDSTGQVEVYAGDILYYPDQDEDNYGIIKFDEDTLAFVLDNGYERFVYGDYGMGKVIGNIYENPELVEG
ncbi:YopX family protein [Streptococcus suis]|uniref:YopX family protein n=1 Tax=Streptococcus suis TaxID=1307 RepID=UPI002AB52D38|nr:YopX family protein [Streptococcus suis]MDY7603049.1 YopX family protein [Streptococcus suis]